MQMPASTFVVQIALRVPEKQGALMVIHPGGQARFTTILHDSPRLAWTEPTVINAKAQRFKSRKASSTLRLRPLGLCVKIRVTYHVSRIAPKLSKNNSHGPEPCNTGVTISEITQHCNKKVHASLSPILVTRRSGLGTRASRGMAG
jgi:hypothetical protein